MTDEELRETIRAELDAHDVRHRMAQRKPTKITDPETGKEWLTGALDKAELVRFAAWCVGGLAGLVFAGLVLFAKVEVYPEVDGRIKAHAEAAKIEMQRITPQFASAVEVATLRKDLEISRAQRIEQFAAIQAQLDRIEQRLDRLGR